MKSLRRRIRSGDSFNSIPSNCNADVAASALRNSTMAKFLSLLTVAEVQGEARGMNNGFKRATDFHP